MDLFGSLNMMGPGARGYSVSSTQTSGQGSSTGKNLTESFHFENRRESEELGAEGSDQNINNVDQSESFPVRVTGGERAAVQNFIRESKGKLGLDIEQLQMAFSQLGLQADQRPSDHHVDQLVQSLSLDEAKTAQAQQIFSDLFSAIPDRPIKDYLNPGAGGLGIVSMMQAEHRHGQLSQSLEDLSQRFFVEQKMEDGPQGLGPKGLMEAKGDLGKAPHVVLGLASQPTLGGQGRAGVQTLKDNKQHSMGTGSSKGAIDISSMVQNEPTETVLGPDVEQEIQRVLSSKSAVPQNSENMESLAEDVGQLTSHLSEVKSNGVTQNIGAEGRSQAGIVAEAPQGVGLANQPELMSQPTPTRGTEMSMGSVRVAESEGQSNINEILNQAQFMARRGGGEVKVILHPEGLGEVNLRVHTKDGQVNVELLTQSTEAKKLLENGLLDLRASLAAQKISVDQIKVEFMGEVAKDFNNPQEQQQRQAAQNFMEQFRQENQAFRRGFLDMPGIRAYKSQIQDPADNEDLIAAIQGDRKRAMAKRLDLVA